MILTDGKAFAVLHGIMITCLARSFAVLFFIHLRGVERRARGVGGERREGGRGGGKGEREGRREGGGEAHLVECRGGLQGCCGDGG